MIDSNARPRGIRRGGTRATAGAGRRAWVGVLVATGVAGGLLLAGGCGSAGTPKAGPARSASPSAETSSAAAETATPSPSSESTPSAAVNAAATLAANAGPEATVVTLVNAERAKAGCAALRVDAKLTKAARAYSTDMATRNFFSHVSPDGVDLSARIKAVGYSGSYIGENIAMGQRDAKAVMQAWMNSSGHRANILNCKYRDIGVGLAYGASRYGSRTPYWTQDFGTPR